MTIGPLLARPMESAETEAVGSLEQVAVTGGQCSMGWIAAYGAYSTDHHEPAGGGVGRGGFIRVPVGPRG